MKLRMGFVSNSSSSSFMIFGKCFDLDELSSKLNDSKVFGKIDKNELKEMLFYNDDCMGELSKKSVPDSMTIFVGLLPKNMREDETLGEFRKRTGDLIRKYVDISDKSLDWYCEGWYDG